MTALPRWSRLALAATGVLGSALFFGLFLAPNLPMYGDSLVEYARWAPTHAADARHEVGILIVTYVAYMIFGVYFATLTGARDGWPRFLARVALVAVGTRFAIEWIQVAVLIVPTFPSVHDFGASMAQFGTLLSTESLIPYAVFLASSGSAALVTRAVPVWLGWFTVGVAAIHVSVMFLGATGLDLGPVSAVYGGLWFLSIPGWPLVTGAALLISAIRKPAAVRVAEGVAA